VNKVICVLRSGGTFMPDHVYALYRNLTRSFTVPFELHALADVPVTCDVYHGLENDWPGWWSKMELFRPGLFDDGDRVVYMDLDTVLVGNVDWLFDFNGSFVVLKAFQRNRWATSLPWDRFTVNPRVCMAMYRGGGDQRFLMKQMEGNIECAFWQDLFPDRVVSYKRHVLLMEDMQPSQDSVVCFHGNPRPWDVSGARWIMEARA